MDIDFANSLPIAIRFSLEPCLSITNAVARHLHVKLHSFTHWLLEKPVTCTIFVTTILTFFTAVFTFILTIFFGTLCTVVLLLLLEGLIIAYSFLLMCSLLSCFMYFFVLLTLIRSTYVLRT